MLREGVNLLNEKLAEVDEDVDKLYDLFFKKDIDEINRTGIITKDMFQKGGSYTSELVSQQAIEADRVNRCTIIVNYGDNFYQPSKNRISLSIHNGAVNYALSYDGSISQVIKDLDAHRQKKSFSKEFTEEKIKGSIHHELSHWLDDTEHNYHITKSLESPAENRDSNINATTMEIQGQIHNIKQLYNKYKDIWDELSFEELLNHSPTLSNIHNQLPFKIRDKWVMDIKKRMYRENLLGKKMYN